jgi:hypothetical protein
MPWADAKDDWMFPCTFAQSDLIRIAYYLLRGILWLPGHGECGSVQLCSLQDIATLGPDRRDIHDGFALSKHTTSYPAFWGHKADELSVLAQEPNRYLTPLSVAKKGRPLRKTTDLWPLASTMLLAERLWVYTQSLVAVRVSEKVLSNVWWTVALQRDIATTEREKALIVWLNSTPGLLVFLSSRVETRGAWIDFKKANLKYLPVLDIASLSSTTTNKLASVYDDVGKDSLLSFPNIMTDPVRASIDQHIAQVLGWPDFSVLRKLLSKEPVVSMKRL